MKKTAITTLLILLTVFDPAIAATLVDPKTPQPSGMTPAREQQAATRAQNLIEAKNATLAVHGQRRVDDPGRPPASVPIIDANAGIRLNRALDIIQRAGFEEIAQTITDHHVQVRFGSARDFQADGTDAQAYFDKESNEIVLNPALKKESKRVLAAILAHEGTHVLQFYRGEMEKKSEYELEFDAFENQATVWGKYAGHDKFRSSSLAQDFNVLYQAAKQGKVALTAYINSRYGPPPDSQSKYFLIASALTLSSAATNLATDLQANATHRSDLNLLYGTSIQATGTISAGDSTMLNNIVNASGYNQTNYLSSLQKTAGLYRALQANSTTRQKFNTVYATVLPATGSPVMADRAKLFGATGLLSYDQTKLLNLVNTWAAATPSGISLSMAIMGNSSYRADLNLLYGTTWTATGGSSTYDYQKILDIQNLTGYAQTNYLSSLQKTAGLYRALQANSTTRQKFNTVYATVLPATGSPVMADRAKLFGATGLLSYDQTKLLNLVNTWAAATPSGISLSMAIMGNSSYRADLNLLYGTTWTATGGSSTYDYQKILDIQNLTGYAQTNYLSSLQKTAGLYRALQANSTTRQKFNTVYATVLPATGSPVMADRTKLFSVTAASNYDQAAFLASLVASTPPTTVTGRLFGATSFWNTKLSSGQTLNSNSSNLVQELVRQTTLAPPWINSLQFSTPYYVVDSSTPKVPVLLTQNGHPMTTLQLYKELQQGVPIPPGAKAAAGTDAHLTIYDKSSDTLYEFWKYAVVNGKPQAYWGGILKNASTSNGVMPIVTNSTGGKEAWGATATGLPAIGGTMMLKELQAGVIPHELAFAIVSPKKGTFVAPANRTDGYSTLANAIPEGTRFRFPANITIDPNWTPMIKMMVTAVRDYGMVLRDYSGAVTFYAEDTTPTYGTTNPYTAFYGGKQLWDVIAQFPWSKLQTLSST